MARSADRGRVLLGRSCRAAGRPRPRRWPWAGARGAHGADVGGGVGGGLALLEEEAVQAPQRRQGARHRGRAEPGGASLRPGAPRRWPRRRRPRCGRARPGTPRSCTRSRRYEAMVLRARPCSTASQVRYSSACRLSIGPLSDTSIVTGGHRSRPSSARVARQGARRARSRPRTVWASTSAPEATMASTSARATSTTSM